MISTPVRSILGCLTLGASLPLIITSSCGRPPVEDLDEPAGSVTVTGAFADWSPSNGLYNNGVFALIDAQSNEVFRSEPIQSENPAFSINDVPITGKYYGVLLDKRYRARSYLQKATDDGKTMRVFQLGSSQGKLGVIVARDNRLEASEQDKLDYSTLGITSLQTELANISFSTNFTANPDIDGDGIPNVIDTDVDGDATDNIFDSQTYNESEVSDSNIPWPYNYGYGIPKAGFFKCDHLFAQKDSTETIAYELKGSCSLRLPAGTVESVKLETNTTFMANAKTTDAGTAFDWKMRDDGTTGDLIADDGIWTGQFLLAEEQWSQVPDQIFIATVTYKNGRVRSYITTLETLKPNERLSFDTALIDTASDKIAVVFKLQELSKNDHFQVELTLYDSGNGTEIVTLTQPLSALDLKFPKEDSPSLKEHISSYLSQQASSPAEVTLRLKLKVSTPAALPGLLGSAFETYYVPGDAEAPLLYTLSE